MGHHVHSPYTYLLFTNVLFERWQYYSFERIEKFCRKTASKLQTCTSDQSKYAQLLQRLCATNNAKNILQLGTGSGITAMYLASNDSKSVVHTYNGISPSTDVAGNFRLMKFDNITLHPFTDSLENSDSLDLLFVRPSQGYTNIDEWFDVCRRLRNDNSIFIFDCIHQNADTEFRWNKIYKSADVTLSLDLYELGIVWFRHDLKKQHYIVKY